MTLSSSFLILGALVSGKEEKGWCRRAGWTCQQTCSFYRLWDIWQWWWGITQVFEKSHNHYVLLFQFLHYFHLMSYTECSSFLSSGLLVVPKVKRRSSRGKGLRRRTQQRRKWTKQQRLAAQMGTAQQRAQHQRRVCIQLLSICVCAVGLKESAHFNLEIIWMAENSHCAILWMRILCCGDSPSFILVADNLPSAIVRSPSACPF